MTVALTRSLFVADGAAAVVRGATLAAAITIMVVSSARADLQLCNGTTSRIGVAIGYKDVDGHWTSEGWWNIPPRACEILLKGALAARYYYIYAVDYDRGGEWSGQAYMCTREKEFTIRGVEDCLARGYDRTGFYEIDTGEQRSWTVQIIDSVESSASQTSAGGSPLPVPPARPGTPFNPLPGKQNR